MPEVLKQKQIDEIRFRVWLHYMRSVLDSQVRDVRVMHIWFPDADVSRYSLRSGNPPSDRDRPAHLKGLRLEIDCTEISDDMRELMRPGGKADDMTEEAVREYGLEGQDIHNIRIEIFERFAKRLANERLRL